MSDVDEQCAVEADHPEFRAIRCEQVAGHDGPHKWRIPDTDDAIEWSDDVDVSVTAGAAFDIEGFVKALPDGVGLCPLCLGIGAVDEEPPFDPHLHVCGTCKGHGRTRTGSTMGENAYRDCTDCQGKGFVPNDPGELPASPARSVDVAGELAPRDHLGRTPDDPEFDWARVVRDVEPVPVVEAS